jgi:hypothetical protein
MDFYKLLIQKVINRILNIGCKIFTRLSFSLYKGALSNRSFDSMSSVLLWMLDGLKEKYPSFELKDIKVAEIGTGQFLTHPVGFLLLGVSKVVSFDLYRQFNKAASVLSFSQNVMAKKIFSKYVSSDFYIKVMNGIESSKFDLIELEKCGIEYKAPFDLQDYKTDNYFDLIFSYTVLEHVPPNSIELLLVKSINVLKSGGKFCHYIDMEDHLNSKQPFDFLIQQDWGDEDCYLRGNRLRFGDWKNIFNKISNIEYEFFHIIRREAHLIPQLVRSQPGFNEENIRVSGILVIGSKN